MCSCDVMWIETFQPMLYSMCASPLIAECWVLYEKKWHVWVSQEISLSQFQVSLYHRLYFNEHPLTSWHEIGLAGNSGHRLCQFSLFSPIPNGVCVWVYTAENHFSCYTFLNQCFRRLHWVIIAACFQTSQHVLNKKKSIYFPFNAIFGKFAFPRREWCFLSFEPFAFLTDHD